MENWSKPCTTHTHVHGPVNGLYVDTGKNGRRPSWTERDGRHGKLGKTTYEAHTRTRTHERAVRGYVKKNGRRPSWTEHDARHGKLGKTMYDAHARTRTRERVREVREKKRPIRHGNRIKTSK